MKNLAGDPRATTECRAELDAAGIPVEVLDKPYGEPQSRVGGKLGDFTFRRAWCYWIVCGPMPLAQAEAMHAHPDGVRDVRVAGHCGAPPPGEWAEWKGADGVDLVRDPDGSQLAAWLAFSARFPAIAGTAEPCRFAADPPAEPGAVAFVTSYHVDTAAGLRLLADTIKSLTPLVPKRQPLRQPKLGEIWHTQAGRLVRVIDIGRPHLLQRQRLVVQKVVAGGLDGAKQTMGLPALLVYYRPPGVAWVARTYQRRPRVGEVWRSVAGSECVILDSGKASTPTRKRHIKARVTVARGSFVAGDITTPLVCEFIRRWSLVKEKAVA